VTRDTPGEIALKALRPGNSIDVVQNILYPF
jgi:hypothetical protein